MKKFLLLLAVVAFSATTFAQDVQFGVKGGLNFANFRGDDADGDTKTDIYLGGFARIGLTEKLAFQPELVYSRQGSKADEDGVDAKWKSNYLNIPLLLRAELANKFHAVFGPQVGIHLSSEAEGSDGDVSVSMDADDAMKDLDLALAMGFEYDITDKFSVGLRYNLGLSEFIDEDAGDSDVKHSVFQLGASFAF
jgi:opacity protein-like surface antigen